MIKQPVQDRLIDRLFSALSSHIIFVSFTHSHIQITQTEFSASKRCYYLSFSFLLKVYETVNFSKIFITQSKLLFLIYSRIFTVKSFELHRGFFASKALRISMINSNETCNFFRAREVDCFRKNYSKPWEFKF